MSYTTQNPFEDTLETIVAMRRQEESIYHKCESIYGNAMAQLVSQDPENTVIDDECRTKLASWCIEVLNFCHMNLETAEIALSYLDRFIMTDNGSSAAKDRSVYQLACVTSLYIAIKIHEPRAIDSRFVEKLSHGLYDAQQIEEMEVTILHALQWRMNPPTSLGFVRQFLALLPNELISEKTKNVAYQLSKEQTEQIITHSEFSTIPASTVAYCALINALEALGLRSQILYLVDLLQYSIGTSQDETKVNLFNFEIPLIQSRLRKICCFGCTEIEPFAMSLVSAKSVVIESRLRNIHDTIENRRHPLNCGMYERNEILTENVNTENRSPRSCSASAILSS